MASSSKQLPLKRRRPRISAELEAAAATRVWSPLETYWDPRYKCYFYAGSLPMTPGQDEKPQVELSAVTQEADSRAASILSSRRLEFPHVEVAAVAVGPAEILPPESPADETLAVEPLESG
ncbi:hypothetical protein HPB52_018699 [Rhipicephalus sanguineus]|uniref:Uncharacterized protein n=1 Tax=Rhipicephalus sanguineus TaxID=34632 RepID=A0A9D4SRE0_RHISA|nr:hypothetical protein HPB52_018699 [Rhipicephalus sanguineus]